MHTSSDNTALSFGLLGEVAECSFTKEVVMGLNPVTDT